MPNITQRTYNIGHLCWFVIHGCHIFSVLPVVLMLSTAGYKFFSCIQLIVNKYFLIPRGWGVPPKYIPDRTNWTPLQLSHWWFLVISRFTSCLSFILHVCVFASCVLDSQPQCDYRMYSVSNNNFVGDIVTLGRDGRVVDLYVVILQCNRTWVRILVKEKIKNSGICKY